MLSLELHKMKRKNRALKQNNRLLAKLSQSIKAKDCDESLENEVEGYKTSFYYKSDKYNWNLRKDESINFHNASAPTRKAVQLTL